MGVVSVLKPKLGTSRRLMCCYCLQLSSEHFYLQKMTELALFIMYFCSMSLSAAFSFLFFSWKKMFSGANANYPAKYLFLGCKWWGVSATLCANVCLSNQSSISFFVSHSWLLSKIWQSNWHFVSQTWRILLPLDYIKLFRLSNAEARVWACAFFSFCLRRPSSWRAMSVWNYWNRRFKTWWTHSQDERVVLTCSQLTCTFKYK